MNWNPVQGKLFPASPPSRLVVYFNPFLVFFTGTMIYDLHWTQAGATS